MITDFILGQYYQGVATGGNEQTDAYGGKVDMYLQCSKVRKLDEQGL